MLDSPASRRSLSILLVAFLGLVAIEVGARLLADDEDDTVSERLLEPPAGDGVWVVGNSIFKTGVEPTSLADLIDRDVAFEYHGGHYTSLWYLIAENALPQLDEQPDVIVWGFRPRYAELPAFRQNRPNSTEEFEVEGDRTYDELATGLEGPDNPFDQLATDLDDQFLSTALASHRTDATTTVNDASLRASLEVLDVLGLGVADLLRTDVVDGDRSLLDVMNRIVTGGEVELAEERVVDGVGDFIEGEPTRFVDGFVPRTAEAIADSGADQLVVIWRPRNMAEGVPYEAEERFVADALEWFADRDIPVLDVYHDERLDISLYGEGDHFNPEGRALVTEIVAERLAELGHGTSSP
ncbi:MAG: hypothetical protein AAGD18_14560 [Actinomycetota bacterium]